MTHEVEQAELTASDEALRVERPTFPAMLSESTGYTPSSPPAPRQPGIPQRVIVGEVEHGNAWGRLLGFPTANLPLDDSEVDGVWAGTVSFLQGDIEVEYVAAISVGTRPTYYADGVRLLEAHLLNFSDSLYGIEVTVRLHKLLRLQEAFDSSDALIDQLVVDVTATRQWAATNIAGLTAID